MTMLRSFLTFLDGLGLGFLLLHFLLQVGELRRRIAWSLALVRRFRWPVFDQEILPNLKGSVSDPRAAGSALSEPERDSGASAEKAPILTFR